MSIISDLKYSFHFDKGVTMTPVMPAFLCGDEEAHRFIIDCHHLNDPEPIDLANADVIAYFIREDGATIPLTGEADGNKVSVVLSASCYAVTGRFSLVIKLILGNSISTVFWGEGAVSRSRTDVVINPESLIPSLDELLAQIDAMEKATTAVQDVVEQYDNKVAEQDGKISQLAAENSNLKSAIYHEETTALDIIMLPGYYVASNGDPNSNSNSACTDYIPVTGGADITLNNVALNTLRSVVAYSNDTVAAANRQRLDDGSVFSGTFTATLPLWAKYVRASTTAGTVITGTEHISTNCIDKAITDAENALWIAEEAEDTLQEIPGIISSAISQSMLKTACRAVIPRPSGLSLTGLDDVTVFATAASYGVTAKPANYKNAITTAIYIDATNGDDTNAGTKQSPRKTIAAAIAAGADTINLMDGTYTFPDGGISQDVNLIGIGDHVIVSGGAYFTGNINIYVENIDFSGGDYPCLVEVGAATEKPRFCAYKCTFENSTRSNGLSIKGEATVRVFDCLARNNYHDGFNYHKNTDISPASGAPNVLECGCEAYGNGITNSSPTSDNGTTAHNYTQIIRVAGNYHDNHGGNVADNGNVKAWSVGCSASASQKTTGDVNNADFWINAKTVMYCDNCYASDSTFDGWAETTSTLYVAGGEIANVHLDGTSTKQTYTSEAVFKYLAE